jgi:iron complex transport system ATP-binding protein
LRTTLDAENQAQAERALALTDLAGLRDRRLGTLSGGQRQRAFIAMALAQNTRLLFLDEPTTFLDARYQVEILRLIARLNREQGITIVMVLHDINQALAYAHEVVGMLDGGIVMQGPPGEVISTESIRNLYGIELPVLRMEGRLCIMTV